MEMIAQRISSIKTLYMAKTSTGSVSLDAWDIFVSGGWDGLGFWKAIEGEQTREKES